MYSLIIIMLISPTFNVSENSKSLTQEVATQLTTDGLPRKRTENYYADSFELTKVESLSECQALGEAYLQTPTHPKDTTKEYGFTCTTTPSKFL